MNDIAEATISSTAIWNAVIDGEDRPAQDNRRFAVTNPATGEEIANVADCSRDDAEAAIKAAHGALPDWRARSAADRGAILRTWYDLMIADEDRLARLITAEMGKPLTEAIGEVRYGAGYLKWFAEEAERIYGEIIPASSGDTKIFVSREPVGVCAAITPWNFPSAMLMRKVAPALAAGCTMVAKPAEDTPLSAIAAAQLALEAGVPPGVFSVLPCSQPAAVGAALTESDLVRKLSFTGSTQVGRRLLADCAPTVKRVSMELGGNAPFIIFDDADLDAALEGAMASKYRNAGQTCVCANRFYVHRAVHDQFCERFAKRVGALKVGDGASGGEVGPLINRTARDKVIRLLDDAICRGARILTGGAPIDDRFFEPTVIVDVPPGSSILEEEIFGPVAPVIPFDTEKEVIAAANATPFGLAAYCYTRDLGRAWRMSDALEYGMVGMNDGIISAVSAPFGGIKQSGMGREGSRHGIDDYLEMKYIRMGGLSA